MNCSTTPAVAALLDQPKDTFQTWSNPEAGTTGTFTVEAFSAQVDTTSTYIAVEPLHQTLISAIGELVVAIDRESDGYAASRKGRKGRGRHTRVTATSEEILRPLIRRVRELV